MKYNDSPRVRVNSNRPPNPRKLYIHTKSHTKRYDKQQSNIQIPLHELHEFHHVLEVNRISTQTVVFTGWKTCHAKEGVRFSKADINQHLSFLSL